MFIHQYIKPITLQNTKIIAETDIMAQSIILSLFLVATFKWNIAGNVNATGVQAKAPRIEIKDSIFSSIATVPRCISNINKNLVKFFIHYLFGDFGQSLYI